MIDLLPHHSAFNVVHAERQRDLRQCRGHHDPVRLDVLEVVQVQAPDSQVAQVVEARRAGTLPTQRHAKRVVIRVIRERDVGQESAGLVLQVSQHGEVLHAVLDRLHMPVQHRAVAADAEGMRGAMHADVVGATQFPVGNDIAHRGAERLGPAAWHRIQSRLAQRDQHVGPRHLLDASDVRDLDRGQRLDVHQRMCCLQRAEHGRVVLEARLHVEAADDVKLARHAVRGLRRLREHLLDGIAIRALFLRQARVAAEDAGLPQHAHVGRIDVLVRRERHHVAMLRPIHRVRQVSHAENIGCPEQRDGIGGTEALAAPHLLTNRVKRTIAQTVEMNGRHGRHAKATPDIAGQRWTRYDHQSPSCC